MWSGHYIHTGAQIGVLVEVNSGAAATAGRDEFKTLVHDLAMQVAAANPQFVSRDRRPAPALDKEREIQRERALDEGKPEKMVDKIVEGRHEQVLRRSLLARTAVHSRKIPITVSRADQNRECETRR